MAEKSTDRGSSAIQDVSATAENGRHPIIGRVAKLMSCRTAAQPACPDLFQNQQGYLLHCLNKFRLHRKIKTRRR